MDWSAAVRFITLPTQAVVADGVRVAEQVAAVTLRIALAVAEQIPVVPVTE